MSKRWATIAEKALELLGAHSAHGTVLAKQNAVAAELGVTRQTLRHYIEALRFVRKVEQEHPAAAIALRDSTATVVGVYSRWYGRDARTALGHAIAASAKGSSSRSIIADERLAREATISSAGLLDRALKTTRRHQSAGVSGEILTAFRGTFDGAPCLGELQLADNGMLLPRAMGANRALRWIQPAVDDPNDRFDPGSSDWGGKQAPPWDLIGVMEAPRGSAGDAHRRNARSLLARAALAATVQPVVVVLLEDAEAVAEFMESLPLLGDTANVGGTSSCVVVSFGKTSGSVVIMAAEDFATTWSGIRP